jgi:phage terminase small subunit
MTDDAHSLTPEQREALGRLTPKRRGFVLAYVGQAMGNATEAARIAGYAKPTEEGHRLLRIAHVATALEALRAPEERASIATIEELRELWSSIARGSVRDVCVSRDGAVSEAPATLTVRLRASELLAKSQGAFLERRENTRPGEPTGVILFGSLDEAARIARGDGR